MVRLVTCTRSVKRKGKSVCDPRRVSFIPRDEPLLTRVYKSTSRLRNVYVTVSYSSCGWAILEQVVYKSHLGVVMEVLGWYIMASMAKKLDKKRTRSATFLPETPDVVRAIAMQGVTDDELAWMFGLDPKIIQGWRKMYSDFDAALEEGRTIADLEVIQALHKKAVGTKITKDVPIKVKRAKGRGHFVEEVEVHTITEEIPPETNAIKVWLYNRDPERWGDRTTHRHTGGGKDEPPIGVRHESKMELMSSILSLIQPKPDNADA